MLSRRSNTLIPVVLFFVAVAALLPQTPTVTLTPVAPSAPISPGATFSAALNLSYTAGAPAGLQFTAVVPSTLSSLQTSIGPVSTQAVKSLPCNTRVPVGGTLPEMTCLVEGLNTNSISPGTVLYLLGTAANNAANGTSTITFKNPFAVDPTGVAQGVNPIAGLPFQVQTQVVLPTVTSLTCGSASLSSNASTSCTVTISSASGNPTTVGLSSNRSVLSVPTSITLNGETVTNGFFSATTGTITVNDTATITASLNGSSKTFSITLNAPAPTFSKCDLDKNGSFTQADRTLALDQALGIAACTTGDVDGDARCTVIDAQNVDIAILTSSCKF